MVVGVSELVRFELGGGSLGIGNLGLRYREKE